MKRPYLLLVLIAVAVTGTGGFFVVRWLNAPKAERTQITPDAPRARTATVNVPAITFTDVTDASGVRFRHHAGYSGHKLLPETMGGGVACFDYDNDGKPDILFVNGRTWPGFDAPAAAPTLRLFRNTGGFAFEDVTARVGLDKVMYGMGVAVGDFDNDGFADVFVSCVGKHHLFRNVGGKTFADVTDAAGVGGAGELPNVSRDEFLAWKPPIPFGSSATFVDYDGDGKLDLFVCHYVTWSPAIDRSINSTLEGGRRTFVQPRDFDGSLCALYRNVDGKRFEDVSAKVGVQVTEKEGTDASARVRPVGKALGVVLCDPDGDGWPDLLVANDSVRNFFFHNVPNPDGTRKFEEQGYPLGAAYADNGVARAGMGIDWAEFAPGRVAAVVANFTDEPLTFLEKDRNRLAFSDVAQGVGLIGPSRTALKFGTLFFDYDNDGRQDLLVCNGHIEPEIGVIKATQTHAQPVQLYWNTGDAHCYFEPVGADRAGAALFKPQVGRGCAVADLDGDGDLDLVLAANGGEARVLRNDAPKANHFVRLDLRGDGAKSNRSAIGAQVTVEAGGQKLQRQISGGRGYLSQSELVLTVGLGSLTTVDRVTVRWPGKAAGAETWTNLDADRTHVLKQGEGK
ncbi:CRTAC1 family protein [Gemmata sp. JC717]|uniref:CRTAC1 family protein n=1 Tax=Gemmata algarum TaxID=2975278 RepID=UPI0021BB148D|nr:CRTAC1 family protein [Gemmata algarum]MDY3556665.1 CRTAC1 family protein [Gemmata algarum]